MGTLALLKVAIGPERGPAIWFLCVVMPCSRFGSGAPCTTARRSAVLQDTESAVDGQRSIEKLRADRVDLITAP
jgi:hypothetical protein